MDPQQRMLLETVYESLESAGYSLQQLKGSDTAVFVGQMTGDYYDVLARDIESVPHYIATGVSRAIMANRISYFFDWKGASLCVDTACSSSLVAVHQAVQELRSGHSKVAVAAGVNIILGPELYIYESKVFHLFTCIGSVSSNTYHSCTCFLPPDAHACGTPVPMDMPEAKASQPSC